MPHSAHSVELIEPPTGGPVGTARYGSEAAGGVKEGAGEPAHPDRGVAGRPGPKLRQAPRHARKAGPACLVTDGTLIPVNRVAADRPLCCGEHPKHGMNLQVIAGSGGGIVGVPGPLPGAVHDLTTARIWGVIGELAASGLVLLAGKGSIGEDDIRAPRRGGTRPASRKDANPGHARLTSWPIVRKLRCCPWRAGHLAKASCVLPTREIGGRQPFKEV